MQMEERLKSVWLKLNAKYCANEELVQTCWNEIESCYSENTRHYHNLSHLNYLFLKLEDYKSIVKDTDTLMYSIFYHDLVYNPKRNDNELKSANLAKKRLVELGLPLEKVENCFLQIMATKEHTDAVDKDTQILLDMDLGILGEPDEQYQVYIKNIRKEYSMYPNLLYNAGRKKVLKHFLEMSTIYKTKEFQLQYEKRAKRNLLSEFEGLG